MSTAKKPDARTAQPVTVRFWTYENDGWVRLALKDGQSLTHTTGGPTDEGYSYSATTWTRDGGTVFREYATESRDCDGRLDTHGEDECPIDCLHAEESFDGEAWIPDWRNQKKGQRDYAAEAAGY